MKLRLALLSLALLAASPLARPAEPAGRIPLPAARTQGPVSVEAALHQRRSLRSPADAPLSLAEVGQLCWAAQGVTDDKGHRTAPSARAAYPLQLYLVAGAVRDLPAGLYRYLPAPHALELVATGDRRIELEQRAVGQAWIARAPAVFVVAGALAKMSAMGDRGAQFMAVEAGLAAQGFFLQAEALGLGSTYVGGFKPREAREVLALPEGEEVLGVLPVGRRP
ncbi:MAG TPA: SagB family peptide dehydrogenase [Anaeromyxobacter sp.]|nr:SagB family peptide dehydrogenase [Anaeromyxobacter sp.]